MNIDWNKIDEECVPLIKFFNNVGLETEFSCQGHGKNNGDYYFYIMFNENVLDKNIKKFLKNYGFKEMFGSFRKWTRLINNEDTKDNWIYEVNISTNNEENWNYARIDYNYFLKIMNGSREKDFWKWLKTEMDAIKKEL